MWSKFLRSEHVAAIVLAVFVGLVTGFGAVGFRYLIETFHSIYFGTGDNVLAFMHHYYIILVPALGGAVVGPLVYFFAREAKGHGVPEVMAAVATQGGKIRPRVAVIKIFASAISIGSGGSVGREGPIVQIGSALGSTLGQLVKAHTGMMRSLVACGAAGGIAATFNAPIGGVLFSLEVIMGRFIGGHLIMVIISSVCSSVVARVLLGDEPAFSVPAYPMNSPYELFLYAILGVIAALIALLYSKTLYKFEDFFDNIKIVPEYVKPVFGGLIIGTIALKFPQIMGVGYESIEQALAGKMTLWLLAALIIMKILATSITIGSGGSGGVFAPGLFIGAMLGGMMGIIYNQMLPDIAAIPAAYALAGMGGVFAASAQAPITGILMLFEMTNDYHLILPLMVTCIISYVLFGVLSKKSIYTMKLARRGLDLEQYRRPDVLKDVFVHDVMDIKPESIRAEYTAQKAVKEVANSPHHGFPVIGNDGRVVGMITRRELRKAVLDGQEDITVDKMLKKELVYIYEDEPISNAVSFMSSHGVGRLPVLDKNEQLVGIISRTDIIRAYGLVTKVGVKVPKNTEQ